MKKKILFFCGLVACYFLLFTLFAYFADLIGIHAFENGKYITILLLAFWTSGVIMYYKDKKR